MSETIMEIREGTFAVRALEFIQANPGCKFQEIHEHLRPSTPHTRASRRDRDRLISAGLVVKQRDGQCVRHYPTLKRFGAT